MKNYKQLTLEQRYSIQAYIKDNKSQKEIAVLTGVNKSTVSRELERNSAGGKYRASEAQRRCDFKSKHREAYKLTDAVCAQIESDLKDDLSPEQIAGKAVLENRFMVSHETIYGFVYTKQRAIKRLQTQNKLLSVPELKWLTCLRTKQFKRQKRKNTNEKRSTGNDNIEKEPKTSIDDRPDIINNKERIGDCEIDTVIGKDHKGAVLTVVERVSKHTTIVKLPDKSSGAVTRALIDLAKNLPFKITSLTSDNGTEFADYATVKQKLGCDFFFAHPYSSWERGLNENTNGLIRQYIPKKTDFDLYDGKFIKDIEIKLNNRPRKTLGFYSPNQYLERNFVQTIGCT